VVGADFIAPNSVTAESKLLLFIANGNRTKLGSIGIFAALVGLVVIILSYPGYKQNLITCTSIGKHGGLRESLPFLLHSLL